jgi:hypothetical protein
MTTSSSLLETLSESEYIIFPKFCICKTQKNEELVFYDYKSNIKHIGSHIFNTKTEYEALENHVHLFDNVKKKDQAAVERISMAIAKNLKRELNSQFPEKHFIVYLELNFKDSVIIRFHQQWENEELYYEPKYLQKEYDSGKIRII